MTILRSRLIVPCLLAGAMVLAACSSGQSRPKTEVPPPSPEVAEPAVAGVSVTDSANAGGTYPYGTAHTGKQVTAKKSEAGGDEEIVVLGPDGTVWVRPAATDAAFQSDVESCYAFARGQIAHDARIESDVNAAFQREASGLGLTDLRQRMNNFERGNRLPSLFNSCMVAKGYSQQ